MTKESKVKTLEELLDNYRTPGERLAEERGNSPRKVIITGGDSGIGRHAALMLAEDNCDVAFTYAHNEEDAELTAEGIRHFGRKAYFVKMDLTEPEAAEKAIDTLVEKLGGLDVFVSNAGMMTFHRFPQLTMPEMQELFNVNFFGAVLATQRAARHMVGVELDGNEKTMDDIGHAARKFVTGSMTSPRSTPGRIIINTSIHEHVMNPGDHVYTMTKHALGGFIKCAAFALAGTNVTVTGVRPGEIATPFNNMHPADGEKQTRKYIPARRGGHPSEIASMIKYLASDETSFINGVSYDVGGGISIGEPMSHDLFQKAA